MSCQRVWSPICFDVYRTQTTNTHPFKLCFQAIIVVAGAWPKTPHPTLMPGGQGSIAPSYEMPKGNFTFYYMELALEGKLTRKVQEFKVNLKLSSNKSIIYLSVN